MFTNHEHHKPKWITKGIQNSCRNKINLHITYRNINDPKEKDYYKKYCAVLRKVIEEFMRSHYNNLIRGSKAIWNTVRENTGNTKKLNEIPKIKYETRIIVDSKGLT